jgi:hypothetical protein
MWFVVSVVPSGEVKVAVPSTVPTDLGEPRVVERAAGVVLADRHRHQRVGRNLELVGQA